MRIRIRFELRRALTDGLAELLPCLTDLLNPLSLPCPLARSVGNGFMDIGLEIIQKMPNLSKGIGLGKNR